MRHVYEPTAESDSADAIFRRARAIGFIVPVNFFVPFVMIRSNAQPNDWQGGRKLVQDDIPGSGRVLTQDLGPQPLTLATGLVFANRAMFQRFWQVQNQTGTLRMNADWTMHEPDRTTHFHGVDYAEFDNVIITSVSGLTFDLAKRPQCDVVFQREDTTWL